MTQEVLTDHWVVKSTLFVLLSRRKTWTENHVLQKLTLAADSIAVKYDPLHKKQSLRTSISPNISVKF